MQKLFLFILFFPVTATAGAQVKRIYGYVQDINAGARLDILHEKESNIEKNISFGTKRYFLFTEVKKGSPISFEQVWIEGGLYTFKSDTIKKIPFVLQSSNGGEMIFRDTLVKSSTDFIIQLKDLVKTENTIVPEYLKKTITENNIVITFKCKNKLLFIPLQKAVNLSPIFAQ